MPVSVWCTRGWVALLARCIISCCCLGQRRDRVVNQTATGDSPVSSLSCLVVADAQALLRTLALACLALPAASILVVGKSDGRMYLEQYEASDRECRVLVCSAEPSIAHTARRLPLRFYVSPLTELARTWTLHERSGASALHGLRRLNVCVRAKFSACSLCVQPF